MNTNKSLPKKSVPLNLWAVAVVSHAADAATAAAAAATVVPATWCRRGVAAACGLLAEKFGSDFLHNTKVTNKELYPERNRSNRQEDVVDGGRWRRQRQRSLTAAMRCGWHRVLFRTPQRLAHTGKEASTNGLRRREAHCLKARNPDVFHQLLLCRQVQSVVQLFVGGQSVR